MCINQGSSSVPLLLFLGSLYTTSLTIATILNGSHLFGLFSYSLIFALCVLILIFLSYSITDMSLERSITDNCLLACKACLSHRYLSLARCKLNSSPSFSISDKLLTKILVSLPSKKKKPCPALRASLYAPSPPHHLGGTR